MSGKYSRALYLLITLWLGLTPASGVVAQATDEALAGRLMEEVIVTAERRSENIQNVSGVVQSLNQAELRKAGINELRQIQLMVPGLSIANQEGNVEIFIRGVGSANNTELGDPAAAPHINGVYVPRPRGLGGMFYDLERVEINKGPQGTLYGRNALAGTLNLITAKPSFDGISGYAQLEAGNRDSYGAEGAVNIPINDSNALRLAGYYLDRDYDFRNVAGSGNDPAGLQEDFGTRLSFLSQVTDRFSVFIMADYAEESGTGYPGANIYSAVTSSGREADDLDLRDVAYRGPEGDLQSELWGIQTKLVYEFDSMSLEYTGSYRDLDFEQRNASSDGIDYPGRDLDALDLDVWSTQYWNNQSESQVHELRLVSSGDGALSWSTGVFYFDEDQEVGYFSLVDKGYCCYSGTEFTMPEVNGESWAVYADMTFALNDRTRVFGGYRYTEEEKDRFGIGGNWALTLGGADFACCVATRLGTEGYEPALLDRPNFDLSNVTDDQGMAQFLIDGSTREGARDTLAAQIGSIADGSNPAGDCFTRPDIDNGFVTCPEDGSFTYANLTIPGQQRGSADADYNDWRIGMEYDLSTDNMVYAKVSTGHKAGGFNDSFDTAPIPEIYDPEEVLVYEIGSRNVFELFNAPATFNVTAFYYDYSDQVLQDLQCLGVDFDTGECNSFSLVNRNLAESELYGLELDSNILLPNNFQLNIVASFLDSEIEDGVVADVRGQDFSQGGATPIIDLSGNRLPLQSDIEVAARLSQTLNIGPGQLDWQVLVNYRSDFYLTQFNELPVTFLDGTVQSALEAGFPDKQDGFATINLGIGYSFGDGWRVEAFGNNVTDEEATQKALVGSGLNLRFLNDARYYGLRAMKNF